MSKPKFYDPNLKAYEIGQTVRTGGSMESVGYETPCDVIATITGIKYKKEDNGICSIEYQLNENEWVRGGFIEPYFDLGTAYNILAWLEQKGVERITGKDGVVPEEWKRMLDNLRTHINSYLNDE